MKSLNILWAVCLVLTLVFCIWPIAFFVMIVVGLFQGIL